MNAGCMYSIFLQESLCSLESKKALDGALMCSPKEGLESRVIAIERNECGPSCMDLHQFSFRYRGKHMNMLKTAVFAAAIACSAVTSSAWASTAQSWNLARDMYLMTESAPGGSPWSFLQNKTAVNTETNYTPFPSFSADQCNGNGVTCWRDTASGSAILSIKKSFVFTGSGKSFTFKQGDVATHPGSNSQTIIRWASPITGNVNVLGRINDLHDACGDGVAWSLNKGDTVVRSGSLSNGGSAIIKADGVAVTPSDSLYLVVDKKADYQCDYTSLDLLITN